MRIRWTEPAARDLTQIADYLEKRGSSAIARRIAISISGAHRSAGAISRAKDEQVASRALANLF